MSAFWTFVTTYILPTAWRAGGLVCDKYPWRSSIAKGFWENTLLPALGLVYNFFTNSIMPTLSLVAAWLSVNIPLAISTLTTWWNGTLMPALNELRSFIQVSVLPVFASFQGAVTALLDFGFKVLNAFWEMYILPNLLAIWNATEPVRKILAEVGLISQVPWWAFSRRSTHPLKRL